MTDEVRMRDAERFALETAGGLFAGRALVLGNIERIEPPNQEARAPSEHSFGIVWGCRPRPSRPVSLPCSRGNG